ncbi:MAG: RHS repeat-associated core domain-containing protein, partial [Bacteroidales bacterium]
VETYSFDAWGNRRQASDWTIKDVSETRLFTRGFTGHEHLDAFETINMNGRLYDPTIARFLSPDPYVASNTFTQDYNRYSYCRNNPLLYTDPSGEWIHLVIGAAIGGVVNLATNWNNIDGVWDGIALFGAGAANGAMTAAFGPLGALGGGVLASATNSLVAQTGKNFEGFNKVDWGQVGADATIGGISSIAGYGAGQWAGKGLAGVVINGYNITSPVVKGMVGGAIGGAAGGYAGGLVGGYLMTGDLRMAQKTGLNGLVSGLAMGGVSGGIGGYAAAKEAGINPWTGKAENSVTIGGPQDRVDNLAKEVTKNQTISDNDIQNWPNDLPAYSGDNIPNPKALEFNKIWIEQVIKAEYYIYDVGRNGYSPFYNGIELPAIQNYSRAYKVTYIRTTKILIIYR